MAPSITSMQRQVTIFTGDGLAFEAAHRLVEQGDATVSEPAGHTLEAEALADTLRASGREVTIVSTPGHPGQSAGTQVDAGSEVNPAACAKAAAA